MAGVTGPAPAFSSVTGRHLDSFDLTSKKSAFRFNTRAAVFRVPNSAFRVQIWWAVEVMLFSSSSPTCLMTADLQSAVENTARN